MTAIDTKTRDDNGGPLPFTAPRATTPAGIPLVDTLGRQTRFQETVHEHHWDDRARIINALADEIAPGLNASAQRMANCAQGASFYIDPSNETVRTWLSRCGHRLCPFCSNARSASTTEDLTELMVKHHADRMIILTIRSHDLPLDLQVASLLHAFKRLRHRATWKRHVAGGVYVLEITRNTETGLWHPHLHILYHGSYYPHAEISKQWREITDGSNVVWVSRVTDTEGAARELAKYIGKPQRISSLEPSAIRSYAYAVKSVRMVQTFGDLYNTKPRDQDKADEQPRTDDRVRLSTLLHVARSGHDEAIVLLTWLCRRYTVFGRYVWHECPQLVPKPRQVDRTLEMLAILRGEKQPARGASEDPLTEEQLEHRICQAYMCYKAQLEMGTYQYIQFYHKTETEQIDGNFRR